MSPVQKSAGQIHRGWWSTARKLPSENKNSRPVNDEISLLVIHNISLPPGEFGGGYIEKFFLNKLPLHDHPYFESIAELKVSAHCLIKREGEVVQFVPFHERAWHAGRSSFEGRQECNDYAIGIELEGCDTVAYTEEQYCALTELTLALMQAFPQINKNRIVGHSQVAPERKTDPGEAFDWEKYRASLAGK